MYIKIKNCITVANNFKRVDQEIKSIAGEILERLPTQKSYTARVVLNDGVTEQIIEVAAEDIEIIY